MKYNLPARHSTPSKKNFQERIQKQQIISEAWKEIIKRAWYVIYLPFLLRHVFALPATFHSLFQSPRFPQSFDLNRPLLI